MMWFRRFSFAVAALWQRRKKQREMEAELRFHLEEETEELEADGVAHQDARLVARKQFGNMTLIQEWTRESWGWSGVERLFQDLRYGLRALRRNTVFTLAATFSLAIG